MFLLTQAASNRIYFTKFGGELKEDDMTPDKVKILASIFKDLKTYYDNIKNTENTYFKMIYDEFEKIQQQLPGLGNTKLSFLDINKDITNLINIPLLALVQPSFFINIKEYIAITPNSYNDKYNTFFKDNYDVNINVQTIQTDFETIYKCLKNIKYLYKPCNLIMLIKSYYDIIIENNISDTQSIRNKENIDKNILDIKNMLKKYLDVLFIVDTNSPEYMKMQLSINIIKQKINFFNKIRDTTLKNKIENIKLMDAIFDRYIDIITNITDNSILKKFNQNINMDNVLFNDIDPNILLDYKNPIQVLKNRINGVFFNKNDKKTKNKDIFNFNEDNMYNDETITDKKQNNKFLFFLNKKPNQKKIMITGGRKSITHKNKIRLRKTLKI